MTEKVTAMEQPPELGDLLASMKIGEVISLNDTEVLAVPMGWIFYRTFKAGITSTFVPYLKPTPNKANIVLPT